MSCSVPQGSVLGPLKFIAYTEDLQAVIEKRSVDPYLYSDDGQLNVHLQINDVKNTALQHMEICAYNLTRQRLKLFGLVQVTVLK